MNAELGPEGLGKLKPIAAEMKTHGIESVRVEFYGGGDSGQIEHVAWSKEPPADTRVDVVIEKWKYQASLEGSSKHTLVTETKSMPLAQAIEEVTYDLLDKSGVDWYNNDGGGGYLEIDLSKPEGTVEFSIHVNELISHEEHYEEVTLV